LSVNGGGDAASAVVSTALAAGSVEGVVMMTTNDVAVFYCEHSTTTIFELRNRIFE